jgi:polar amino acid transport system substrate-binding protein
MIDLPGGKIMMTTRCPMIIIFSIVLLGLGGCATTGVKTGQAPVNPILVGVTPIYPPVIFKMSGQITGLEADLARRLAAGLRRPIEFVEISWEEQIPTLLKGKIDIIMSGMTITQARQVRITFSQPYLKSGLMIAFTAENASQYASLKEIIKSIPTVGFVEGTTGEAYARNIFREGNRMIPVKSASEAALALKNRRIDIFVYDAPAVAWIVSENEAKLKFLPELLNIEYLGWGLRRDDRELLVKVNALLSKWEKDGTLKETILKWLPYWKQF